MKLLKTLIQNMQLINFGFFGNMLKNAYDAKAYYRPNSAIGVYGKLLGGLGIAISLLGLTVDISNTWNANNSNTNGQRLSKTCLQTGVFILQATASYYFIGLAATGLAGGIFVPEVLVPFIVLALVIIVSNYLLEYAYEQYEIE